MMREFYRIAAAVILTASLGMMPVGAEETNDAPKEWPVVAVVLSEEITLDRGERVAFVQMSDEEYVAGKIVQPLFDKYVRDKKLVVLDEEVEELVRRSDELMREDVRETEEAVERLKEELKNPDLSPREREAKDAELRSLERFLKNYREMNEVPPEHEESRKEAARWTARRYIFQWKRNKALFDEYGGRVVFQQMGMEPYDAFRQFLKDREKDGSFRILDEELRGKFWAQYPEDPPGPAAFVSEGEKAKEAINRRWWLEAMPEALDEE